MITNGGSQDRYPDERRDIYQYRNGNVSREDFGEEMSDRRRERGRDNNISNAVLNHLAGMHRRPVNRVSFNIVSMNLLNKPKHFCLFLELESVISSVVSSKGT